MKKTYEKPTIQITMFEKEDSITTSAFGNSLPGYTDEEFPG